jgi:hypothetical protein
MQRDNGYLKKPSKARTVGQILYIEMAMTTTYYDKAKEFVEGSSGSCIYVFKNGTSTVFE